MKPAPYIHITSNFGPTLCGYVSGRTVTNQSSGAVGGQGLPDVSHSVAWLAKYDANGIEAWDQQFGTGIGASANAIAVDSEGNVYITGGMENPGNEEDAWVAKYDALGYQVWFKRPVDWNTEWGDAGLGIAADQLGNVFIVGERRVNTGGADAFLSKFDTEGQEQWIRTFNGTFFTNAVGSGLVAVTVDGCGNAVFAGGTDGDFVQTNNNGDFDAVVGKMDGNGNLVWGLELGTDAAEAAYCVATDLLGKIYVAGPTYGAMAAPNPGADEAINQGQQFWFARLSGDGALECIQQLGTLGANSLANAVAVDSALNLYVAGSADGDLGAPSLGRKDGFLARFTQGDVLRFRTLF
jgi:hypothetical protein